MSTSLKLRVSQKKLHIKNSEEVPSIGRQAELLGIARSSFYYQPLPVNPEKLFLMNKIDEIYTKRPFYGVRRITWKLREEGYMVNHKRVHHLMQEMGIQALYPKPNLSKNNLPHLKYPYLLKGVTAGYPNHIWGTDITYIRMKNGFVYLTAFLDWYARFILSWRLSTTLETAFCYEAAEEAIVIYGAPYIINEDQGVQNTDHLMINLWESNKVKISMDHKGRCFDNIFTERLWRDIKYEEVYLKSYETVREARQNIGDYIEFHNNERPHQSLGNRPPREIYEKNRKRN